MSQSQASSGATTTSPPNSAKQQQTGSGTPAPSQQAGSASGAPQQQQQMEQMGSQVVHVRGDSDSDLEALFKAVMNPSERHLLQLPMRLRKLPPSFFQPPDMGSRTSASHSRDSSNDSSAAFGPPSAATPPAALPSSSSTQSSGLVIHHPRAHSSPASLQQTLASAQNLQHQHIRQQSYDITDDTPLPPGWDMAKTATGQRYFLNPVERAAWKALKAVAHGFLGKNKDPNFSELVDELLKTFYDLGCNMSLKSTSCIHTWTSSLKILEMLAMSTERDFTRTFQPWKGGIKGNGPQGCLQTTAGLFFGTFQMLLIRESHITQTTTWEDPRIKKLPLNATVSLGHLAAQPPASQASGGGSSGAGTPSTAASQTAANAPISNALAAQNLGPLPEGWEQATTPEAMHLQRPAVLQQVQQQQQQQSANGGTSQSGSSNLSSVNNGPMTLPTTSATTPTSNNDNQYNLQRQQQVRLQHLQMEREQLRRRQQEIMQELLMQQNIAEPLPPTSPTMDLPALSNTGLDPFLSGTRGGTSDYHSRQESADSGLGMGNTYSLPHTPEGFLSPMDDSTMEPGNDDSLMSQAPASDLDNLGLGESNNMDSDDLEPSLQEELSSDILNDVEALLSTSRMDNVLTWL